MKIVIFTMVIMSGMFFSGCASDEKKAETPKDKNIPAVQELAQKDLTAAEEIDERAAGKTPQPEITEEAAEPAGGITDMVNKTAAVAEDETAKMANSAKEKATEAVSMAKDAALSLTEKPGESVSSLVPDSKVTPKVTTEEASALIEKQKSATASASSGEIAAISGATGIAAAVSKTATETAGSAEKAIAGAIAPPETVTIDNDKGKVTLPHKTHGENFTCQTCHGDLEPGPLTLGKDKAHTLCKGCHTEKGGPTRCSDCHEKKAVKAVEGC